MENSFRFSPGESILLLDESLIESEEGVRRKVIPGKKIPFVMEPDEDKPWEFCGPGMTRTIHLYGTTLYDQAFGKYRMWYMCRMGAYWRFESGNYQVPGLYIPRTDERPYSCNGVTRDKYGRAFVDNDRGDLTCYAESEDGLHWEKPELGIFTFDGSAANNIVWDLHGASVFIDPVEDPDKRYKAIGFCRRYRNIFLLTSPDGLRWEDKDHIEPLARRANEGSFNVTHDSEANLYRAYSISRFDDWRNRRVICYTESPRLEGPWKEAQVMLDPTSWDDEIARRRHGALRAEFHNMSAFRYDNLHLGLLGVLSVTAEQISDQEHQMPCDGPIESQFVYSRDGINWAHVDRERTPAIPLGEAGAFDRGMIMGVAKEPLIEGDEVHWYYTGAEHTHGETNLEKRVKRLGRVTWRRDRFVALQANERGVITTKALHPPEGADTLEVNADATSGQLSVEICDARGAVLRGFSRADCLPLTRDALGWRVQWKDGDIFTMRAAVKLRFVLNRTRIYSFKFRGR